MIQMPKPFLKFLMRLYFVLSKNLGYRAFELVFSPVRKALNFVDLEVQCAVVHEGQLDLLPAFVKVNRTYYTRKQHALRPYIFAQKISARSPKHTPKNFSFLNRLRQRIPTKKIRCNLGLHNFRS